MVQKTIFYNQSSKLQRVWRFALSAIFRLIGGPAKSPVRACIKLFSSPFFLFFRVKGQSMEPYIKEGDFAFVCSLFGPGKGDVAILKHNNKFLLKRVQKIEESKYWFEGDNRVQSTDSRTFGWVEKKDVVGKALVICKTKAFRFGIMN